MNTSINEKLRDLKTEDIIWIIYFFLALASIISNQYERTSIIANNQRFNNTSKKINVTIFIITFFIYLYFVFINWRDIERLKKEITSNNRNILTNQARLVAALLFLVGGTIYLVTEIQSSQETEIGFI